MTYTEYSDPKIKGFPNITRKNRLKKKFRRMKQKTVQAITSLKMSLKQTDKSKDF